MKIYEIHNIYGIHLFWKEKMGYILYSNKKKPQISVLHREMNCLNRENENLVFYENMDFDLQNTGQSHYSYENLKWSHGHYGHFALAGLTGNPCDESVESAFFKSLGLISETIFDNLT